MGVRYLSEEYWQQVGSALDTARQLGFKNDRQNPSGQVKEVTQEIFTRVYGMVKIFGDY